MKCRMLYIHEKRNEKVWFYIMTMHSPVLQRLWSKQFLIFVANSVVFFIPSNFCMYHAEIDTKWSKSWKYKERESIKYRNIQKKKYGKYIKKNINISSNKHTFFF